MFIPVISCFESKYHAPLIKINVRENLICLKKISTATRAIESAKSSFKGSIPLWEVAAGSPDVDTGPHWEPGCWPYSPC